MEEKKPITSVNIVYFSGTGGTARIAETMENQLKERGVKTEHRILGRGIPAPITGADLIILLYPVYALNAPLPVDEWVESLPEGDGRPVAICSVSGGGEVLPNTACRLGTIRGLKKKGYTIAYEYMFVMPSNIFMSYSSELASRILRVMPERTELVITELLEGKVRRLRASILDRGLAKIGVLEKKYAGKRFGGKLQASEECSGCGWCAEHCPRKNITMSEGKPQFGAYCVICLGCVYGCPKKAITLNQKNPIVLKEGYNLAEMERRSKAEMELSSVDELTKNVALLGVRKYLNEKK